ncbi:NAD(P)/FAD-dependent oxidoreductase [Nocardiopsis coralliicola]
MIAVTVVGAGAVGASLAWHLARAGARVTVCERGTSAVPGASGASFSRVTAFGKRPGAYFDLNAAGLAELHRLRDSGTPGFHPCPSLVWPRSEEALEDDLAAARAHGYAAEPVAPDHPAVPSGADRSVLPPRGVLLPGEGWVDLPALTGLMLARAAESGAAVRTGAEVTGIATGPGGAVHGTVGADGRTAPADVVVNAAGAGADAVAALAGGRLRLAPTRGLLADLLLPDPPQAQLLTPRVSIRPAGPGRVRVRSGAIDARLPAVADGAAPDASPGAQPELALDLAARAAELLPELAGVRPAAVRAGVRAFPADGVSSVGYAAPGYYEAVTHSGAGLAPLLGRLAAEEIIHGRRSALLAPFSPGRPRPEGPAARPGTGGGRAAAAPAPH